MSSEDRSEDYSRPKKIKFDIEYGLRKLNFGLQLSCMSKTRTSLCEEIKFLSLSKAQDQANCIDFCDLYLKHGEKFKSGYQLAKSPMPLRLLNDFNNLSMNP
jgi:hypothetical protein